MRNIKNGLIMKITGFIAISFSIVCKEVTGILRLTGKQR